MTWPTSIAGDGDLFVAKNNLSTMLDGAIDDTTTTVKLSTVTGFPTAGYVTIGDEAIKYTGITGVFLDGVVRGADGTVASAHANSAPVFHYVVAAHHNILKDEVVAIETDLNTRIGFGDTSTIKAVDGSTTLPSHTFASNPAVGMSHDGSGNLFVNSDQSISSFVQFFTSPNKSFRIAPDGLIWWSDSAGELQADGQVFCTGLKVNNANLGSAGAPALSIGTTNISGFFKDGSTWALKIAVQDVERAQFTVTGLDMESNKITGLANGTVASDAVNKGQLDAKQDPITGGATTIVSSNLTASRALSSDGSGKVAVSSVTSTELGYVAGVTGALQTQLNSKFPYHGIEAAGALSFDNSTHVLTVAAGTNTYWYLGTRYTTASAITCDIDSFATLTANTLYFIYFDDASGTLKASTTPWDLDTAVTVATVYWNGSVGAVANELHGYRRNIAWHKWAHNSIGTRYGAGLSLTNPTTVNDALLQIESGNIYDEDLELTIAQQTTCRFFYQASAGVYTFSAGTGRPYPGSAGAPQFLDTDTYTLSTYANGDYANMWVYASDDISVPIYIIPTAASAAFTSLANARAENPPALAGLNIIQELRLLYKLIYAGNGQFQEATDYRNASSLPAGGTASTTAAAVSFAPTGNVASTTVQAAIAELDTEKEPLVNLTASRAIVSSAGGALAAATTTSTEIGYVNGVTSAIQTQLNNKAASGAVTSSGLTMATDRLLGRSTASAGAIEEITVGSGLTLSGGSLTASGGASYFTQNASNIYPTTTTDNLVLGEATATARPGILHVAARAFSDVVFSSLRFGGVGGDADTFAITYNNTASKWNILTGTQDLQIGTGYPTVGANGQGIIIKATTGYVSIQPAGAASTPALYLNGDVNTGLWAPASDTLAVSTGGTERLRIDSDGKVGVGVTPTTTLHVDASGGAIIRATRLGTGSNVVQMEADGTNGTIRSDGALILNTGGANERVRITSTGLVGIGRAPVNYPLEVTADIGANTNIVGTCLQLNTKTSGTAEAGIGSGITFGAEMDSGSIAELVDIQAVVTSASAGSRSADIVFASRSAGSYGVLFTMKANKYIVAPGIYNQTTGSAANVAVDSSGNMLRSTSSLRYKTAIKEVTQDEANLLLDVTPVTYASTCDHDDKEERHYGLIAEELHLVDPVLVTYKTVDGEKIPDGVQYERVVVGLLKLVQDLQARVKVLEGCTPPPAESK